jgi:ATP-dependent RNA helicase RhlE
MSQRAVSLRDIEIFVLDEADRMLDMGFVRDVKRIASKLPQIRQTLLFSATLPDSIRSLAHSLLRSPVSVAATPTASAPQALEQSVYFVEKANKRKLLAWILRDNTIDRALAFTRTKHSANRVAQHLSKCGISADAIHGDKSQNARMRALEGFKRGQLRVLVATDIAARGIDIDQLSYVINYDLPNAPETYVHRIGRTARAGNSGQALSFCESDERPHLQSIERLICKRIPVMSDHLSALSAPDPIVALQPIRSLQPMAAGAAAGAQTGGGGGQQHGGRPRHFSRRRRSGRAGAPTNAS